MIMMLHGTHCVEQLSGTYLSVLSLWRDFTKQLGVELGVDFAVDRGFHSCLVEGRLRDSRRDSPARSLMEDQGSQF